MITPAEIYQKVARLYTAGVQAWLAGDDSFFPRRIPANLSFHGLEHYELIQQVEQLRQGSKQAIGYGYSIRFERKVSRKHGENLFPSAIEIVSLDDLLLLLRKQKEFRVLVKATIQLRSSFPQLEPWIRQHWKRLILAAEHLPDLLQITQYMLANPNPDCYLRELPLPISTKILEQHKPLLGEWFNLLLPAHAINHGCDPRNFEQRYGFRYARKHLLVRVLDRDLLPELGIPFDELCLPAQTLAVLPSRNLRVIVVENKINLLTLPQVPRGIAFGGLGNDLSEFNTIEWLKSSELHYWGDIDVAGFQILERFRRAFPQTQSLLMDRETLDMHATLCTPLPKRHQATVGETQESANANSGVNVNSASCHLSRSEQELLAHCQHDAIQLEQEHLPQTYVTARIRALVR
ncbi:Wadjet anti-phage system protein JetD domain-containing protein [Aureliella helgolandensis]|uniref:Wadjet protein JetD C-terminal domain-containing protein n=1 Tax=Aureliella helgolandensis TaxID=2527968 RepID=A0A518GH47_9BACT|nr:Wadjet anti-phage system protein JetD domain-containing protein [Aureliella helgolandensis]QDV27904.1 hypothetical protein Q31a_62970 [Aureliella helgolandensis]